MGHHYHDLVATFRLRRRDVVRAKFTESNDHEELYNREKPNQHPIEAITDLTETLALKQNLLIDGVNIKTINGENILGEGNIEIQGGSGNIDDVKVNGTSVVANKIANIQIKTINGTEIIGEGNVEITIPTKVSDLINDSSFQTQTQLNTAISNHNNSNSAHSDIRQSIANASQGISNVEELIPNQASSENQLADKNFVNSSVATNTANFIGTFNSISELENYSGTITNNDYAFVISTDQQGNTIYNRYKYNSESQEWLFEYALNNSSFTANQWAAINSDITANKVTTYDGYGTSKQDTLVSGTNIKTVNGNNLLGSGNVAITTYTAFNSNWHNSSSYTTFDFCESVNADPNAIVGMAYLGALKCNDIPIPAVGNVKQGDATVKIIGQGSTSKIITIELSSSSTYPYKWQITYHSHTIDEPGWIGFQPELPSQSGQSGKFLTTNGTTMSWETVSGGSSDYNNLTNKPSINNMTLSGNKSADDLGLQSTIDTDNKLNANLINGLSTVATSGSYNDLLNKPTLATVATSGSYTDLTDKPTIPTVNNSTITITQGGVTKGTFTLNQNSASTINLDGSQDLSNYILKPTIITDANSSNLSIAANTIYKFTNALSALNITSAETSDYESVIYFTTGSGITFTDSSGIKWGGGLIPALEINTIYCISIRNGLAEIDKFGTTI